MANFNWLQQWSQHKRQMGHSVFDLSKKMCFHLPNSMIVPIRFIETVPDDHFIINMSGLMRTETMNKAAFYQGKAVFSAFFVPYKQLWHNFNQFVVVKEDKHSVRYRGSNYAPVLKLKEIIEFVANTCYVGIVDEFGYPAAYGMARLLQFAKIVNMFPILKKVESYRSDPLKSYTDFENDIKPYLDEIGDKCVNMWRLLAYQHIYYDFYRNKYYDELPFFQSYDPDEPRLEYINTFNVDHLNCTTPFDNILSPEFGTFTNSGSTNGYADPGDCLIANILSPHYCQYRRDLYTSLLPSTQFGAVSGLTFTPSLAGSGIVSTDDNDIYHDYGGNDASNGSQMSLENGGLQYYNEDSEEYTESLHAHDISMSNIANRLSLGSSNIDVLSFRRAELLQQWKQNALRAGNMVDANFESHYGVKPFYEDDNNVRFLGQFECKLDVNPVTATADTDSSENGKVGDLAAYGVGSLTGHEIDVQIKDFGVIVICAHFASEVYYSANGIDKQNTLIEPLDYFQSEFENAGLDVVSAWQQSLGLATEDALDMAFGFTPPYTMYKTEVDEVFGEYSDMFITTDDHDFEVDFQGSLSAWTAKRSDLVFDDGNGDYYRTILPLSRFYQSPKVTDSIFGVQYDAKGATDPFGFAVNIDVKAIRPMSVIGIPIFA